jgi:Ribose 5-phosphate isomerase RpiB
MAIVGMASDHAGFEMKEALKPLVKSLGYEIKDFGAFFR